MFRVIVRLALLMVTAGLLAAGYVGWTLTRAHKGFAQEVIVDLPPGTSTREMASKLASTGVVPNEWSFLAVRALRTGTTLQAGEYKFEEAASPWDVFSRIARGDVLYFEIRVPEGYNMFDIGAELERQGIMKASQFIAAAQDPGLIRDLAADAPSLEGYLFPASYRMTRNTTAKQLCYEMTQRFRRTWSEVAKPGADVHDMVTLASLVEKETGVSEERPQVSSVFHNRLAKGMTLDCDPTIIYAALLEKRFRGTIYRSDLENPHPYNTYRHAGLPPGPIANPGLASLKAALEPAETDYVFFVAKPDGSGAHEFSANLAEHNENVEAYRRGQQKK